MSIEVQGVEGSRESLIDPLVEVWERSVRATHAFLNESDIAALRPEARSGIATVEHLAVVRDGRRPVAFAGAQRGKLEMLFCDAPERGRGMGKALLAHAVSSWDVHRLDVNEENPTAVGFYEHEGFEVVARSSHDGAGRAFPLLHLSLASGPRFEVRSGEWANVTNDVLLRDRAHASSVSRRLAGDASLTEEQERSLLEGLLGAYGIRAKASSGARFDYGYNVFFGMDAFCNFNCTFLDSAPIVFGDGAMAGPGCVFATPLHPLRVDERYPHFNPDGGLLAVERALPIHIGKGAWLASSVTVNPGVTIGDGSVIGSGSVVTRDVPAGVLAFGNPCRVIRQVSESDRIDYRR